VRTKRSAPAFALGERIGVLRISMPSLRKMASKSRVNLLSRSRTRKRAEVARSGKVQGELARLLCHPGAAGIGRTTREMNAATAKLDEEEHVQPLQRDRLDCEEVDGEHAPRCARRKAL
jgi:hypothetical protein